MDKKDLKILAELDVNARAPYSILSKKLHLSRDVIKYRMNRMEEKGIIKGYSSSINAARLGYVLYRVYLKFSSITNKDIKKIINHLEKNENIFWMGETEGIADFALGVYIQDKNEFQQFIKDFLIKFRNNIEKVNIEEVLKYIHLNRAYLGSQKERTKFIMGGKEESKIDNKDIKILNLLSKDARIKISTLANELNMESPSILERLKNLKKKNILQGFRVDLNLEKLNREFYTVKINLTNQNELKRLKEYIQTKKEVTSIIEAVTEWDVEFDLEVRNTKEYHALISDLKEKFSSISKVRFYRVINLIRLYNPI